MSAKTTLQKFQEYFILSRKEGGFGTSANRSQIWSEVLSYTKFDGRNENFRKYLGHYHRDKEQIQFDVERSLWHFDEVSNLDASSLLIRRESLSDIITAVFCKNPTLYYYQGFHDFVSIFLLIVKDEKLTFELVDSAVEAYITDFMGENFSNVSILMELVFTIFRLYDYELYDFLVKASVEPYFYTSWLLTWFSHDVKSINAIARIYDALLCSHPIFIFYLCAAVSKVRLRICGFMTRCFTYGLGSHSSSRPYPQLLMRFRNRP